MKMKKLITGTMIAACLTMFSLPTFAATGTAAKTASKTKATKVVTTSSKVKATKANKSAKKSNEKAAKAKKAAKKNK